MNPHPSLLQVVLEVVGGFVALILFAGEVRRSLWDRR